LPPWHIVFLTALRATAEPAATPVSWRAPQGCPDGREVARRILALVGREPTAGEIRVDGTVRRVEGGFALRLRVDAGTMVEERSIVADRCAALADTTALVTALMVDPIATTEKVLVPEIVARAEQRAAAREAAEDAGTNPSPRGAGAPENRGRDDGTSRTAASRDRRDRSGARRPVGVWARVGGGGQFGAVPGLTGGLALALAVGTERVRGELGGSYWFPRTVGAGDDVTLRVHLGVVSPRICGVLPQGRIGVVACGGVELGAMRGDAAGGTRLPLWLGVTAELGVRVPVAPRIAVRFGVGAVAPVVFPVFRLVDSAGPRTREVYRPAGAAVRVDVGVEIRLRGVETVASRRRR